MRLEVNKRYLDKRGKAWTIVRCDSLRFHYPFMARDAFGYYESFTEDGRWSRHVPYMLDLVELAPEVVEPVAVPALDAVSA